MKKHLTAALVAGAMVIGLGVGFGVSQAQPAQPHMQNALASLQAAASELQLAERDKGGHRAKALALTNQAITQVQAGMAVGAGL
jgi:hypothetical protein